MWALAQWSVTYIFTVKDDKENECVIAANTVDLHQFTYHKLH